MNIKAEWVATAYFVAAVDVAGSKNEKEQQQQQHEKAVRDQGFLVQDLLSAGRTSGLMADVLRPNTALAVPLPTIQQMGKWHVFTAQECNT